MSSPDELSPEGIDRLEEKIESMFPAKMPDEVRARLEDDLRQRLLSPVIRRPAWSAFRPAAIAASLLFAFFLGWYLRHPPGGQDGRGAAAPDLVQAVLVSRLRGGEGPGAPFRADDTVNLRLEVRAPVLAFVIALTPDLRVEPLSSALREVTPENALLAFKLEGFAAGPLGLVIVTTTEFRSSQSILGLAREAARSRLERAKAFDANLAELARLLSAGGDLHARTELLRIVE